jgi:uncharacterized membrane protein SpoIIM required for sporulation
MNIFIILGILLFFIAWCFKDKVMEGLKSKKNINNNWPVAWTDWSKEII